MAATRTTLKKKTPAKKTKAPAKKTKAPASGKKAPAKKPSARTTRVVKITPSADGARWTVLLSDGASRRVSAAAAQSVGVRVGGAWSDSTAAKVAGAAEDQKLFQRAMAVLAKRGRMAGSELEKVLGAGPGSKRAVAALRRNGWLA